MQITVSEPTTVNDVLAYVKYKVSSSENPKGIHLQSSYNSFISVYDVAFSSIRYYSFVYMISLLSHIS